MLFVHVGLWDPSKYDVDEYERYIVYFFDGMLRAGGGRTVRRHHGHARFTTKGPMWGYPVFVLGAVCSFLEPFRGHLSPNIDDVSEKLTLRYPHKGPWVEEVEPWRLEQCGSFRELQVNLTP